MIRIDSLSHTYPRQKESALDSFSLELAEGAITGFIGPNGSGKTTLFKALAGRILPSSGQVLIDGRPAGREELIAHCLYVGDDKDLSPVSAKNALLYARCRPTWDEALFTRLAQRFELSLKGTLSRRSLGQRALFTAALGLASGAPITLLDEPSGNLDVPTRLALAEEIIRVNAEAEGARTILISSHLVSELESLIEHVVVLKKGRLVTAMPAEELRSAAIALVGNPTTIRAALASEAKTRILDERPLGRLAEIRIVGHTSELLESLSLSGIEIQPLSFQDAFVSLISEEK